MFKDIKKLNVGDVFYDVDLSCYTTYKINSTGAIVVEPTNIENLKILIKYIKEKNYKYKILGNGSNLIFTNSFYDGILIRLNNFCDLDINENIVTVGAGYNLMKLALKCSMMGLSGLEFATGIPGSVGGSVYMNAGAYNSDISSVLVSAVVLTPDLDIVTFKKSDFDFSYRMSYFQKYSGYVCLSAKFKLQFGDKDEIMALVNDRRERRFASQPLEFPSAGSVFRNPTGDYAGRLIEEIGYKGKKCGGAQVSLKHANFIVNAGGATGSDIKKLIFDIKSKIKEKYGIDLKVEQEFVE
jgi:UDP-N-acetylmuramate dehydrogenase